MTLLIKIFALRSLYFKDGWNVLDFVIVLAAVVSVVLEHTTQNKQGMATTVVRSFRIFRMYKMLHRLNKLQRIFMTFVGSLPDLLNVGSLLFLVLFVYAVLGMNLFATVAL